jgi:outer membrane protein TolC
MKTNRKEIIKLNMQTLLKINRSPIYLLLAFLFFMNSNAMGQTKSITVVDTTVKRDSVRIIEDKLVELALKGPMYEASKHQNKINELQLKKVKNSWLNFLTISANYNDQTFKNQPANATYVYPKFYYGINIPLGVVFSSGSEVKSAREAISLSKNNQEQLARDLRADVLTKYRQYRAYADMISLEKTLIYDVKVTKEQAEKKFGQNQISIETYNTAIQNYSEEQNKLIALVMQQDLIKIDIEKSIGIPLEDAIAQAFQK